MGNQVALGIGQYIAGVRLEKIRFDKEPCFTAAAAADDQHVFIPGMGGILGAV